MDTDLERARALLIDWMKEYSSYYKMKVYIVFDAYMRHEIKEKIETIENVTIIFTKKGQTADSYIEKMAIDLSTSIMNQVQVVTKDWVQQQMVINKGASRMTPRELYYEYKRIASRIKLKYQNNNKDSDTLESMIDEGIRKKLSKISD